VKNGSWKSDGRGILLVEEGSADFPASDLRPQRPRVTVIIPAFNEERSIAHVLRDIPRDWADEVIVVDNGSTDATARIARDQGAIVVAQPERGYGAACLAGIASLPKESEVIVFLDAD